MTDDQLLASDQLNAIRDWLDYVQGEHDNERISYGELIDIEQVYNIIKDEI
jgi:hypothetical protein